MDRQKIQRINTTPIEKVDDVGAVFLKNLIDVYKDEDFSKTISIENHTLDQKSEFSLRLKHIITPYSCFEKTNAEIKWFVAAFELLKNQKPAELQEGGIYMLERKPVRDFIELEILKMSSIGSENEYRGTVLEKIDENLFFQRKTSSYFELKKFEDTNIWKSYEEEQ